MPRTPRAEEALSTAYMEAVWDLRRSVVLWDLVWEGGASRTGGPEGQLESLRRSIGSGRGISPSYPSLCSLCVTVRGVRLEERAQILEGFVSTRSAWLLASPQGACSPLTPRLLTPPVS